MIRIRNGYNDIVLIGIHGKCCAKNETHTMCQVDELLKIGKRIDLESEYSIEPLMSVQLSKRHTDATDSTVRHLACQTRGKMAWHGSLKRRALHRCQAVVKSSDLRNT